jgi:hypothetical protein
VISGLTVVGRTLGNENRCSDRRLTRRVPLHHRFPWLDLSGIGLKERLAVERLLGVLDGGKLGGRLNAVMC